MNYTDILIELRATLRDLDLKLSLKTVEVDSQRRHALLKVILFFHHLEQGRKPPLSIDPETADKMVALRRARISYYDTERITRLITAETFREKEYLWQDVLKVISPVVVGDVTENQLNLF